MKILVVTHSYAPALNPRSFRWSAIAEHWAGRGHQVDIVAAAIPGCAAYEEMNGVRVHRVGAITAEVLRTRVTRTGAVAEARNGTGAANGAGPAPVGLARRLMKRVHDLTWRQLYWPDYACLWYGPARRKTLELLAGGGYDGLVTSSVPFTSHLVGLAANARTPALPWIVDIGDPFSFDLGAPPNNMRLYSRLNRRVEADVFSRARAVTVTTEPTRREYARLFPQSAEKLSVIPPLLSLQSGPVDAAPFFPKAEGRIRMVFVGTFYRKIRSPEFLLRVFDRLLKTEIGERLELHLVGRLHDCDDLLAPYQPLVGRHVFIHGMLDRGAAHAAMREADVLVNVGNDNIYQLPSKLVEYVSVGRPVLNVVKTEADNSLDFFRGHPASFSLLEGPQVTDAQVDALVRFLSSPPEINDALMDEWTASFRIDAIAAPYERLLR